MATYPLSPLGFNLPFTGSLPPSLSTAGSSPLQGGPGESHGWDARVALMRQLQMLEPILDLLSRMLGLPAGPATGGLPGGPAGGALGFPAGTPTGLPTGLTTPNPTTPPTPTIPTNPPTAAPPVAANTSSAAPTQPVAAATPGQTAPNPGGRIGAGSRVLVIGDSHTAGIYGTELDRQLRARGARVHTVGSSGASATNFINGRGTTVGYAEHGTDGRTTRTASHATPRLEDLINQDRPDTIVVNLGANFRGANPAQIQSQVSSLGEIARRHGIAVKWVGPPKPRDGNPAQVQRFDQQMAAAVAPYGEYISSVPYTPEYAGPDGRHYGGARGTQLAQQWAQGIASRL